MASIRGQGFGCWDVECSPSVLAQRSCRLSYAFRAAPNPPAAPAAHAQAPAAPRCRHRPRGRSALRTARGSGTSPRASPRCAPGTWSLPIRRTTTYCRCTLVVTLLCCVVAGWFASSRGPQRACAAVACWDGAAAAGRSHSLQPWLEGWKAGVLAAARMLPGSALNHLCSYHLAMPARYRRLAADAAPPHPCACSAWASFGQSWSGSVQSRRG